MSPSPAEVAGPQCKEHGRGPPRARPSLFRKLLDAPRNPATVAATPGRNPPNVLRDDRTRPRPPPAREPLHGRARLPQRGAGRASDRRRRPVAAGSDHRGAEGEGESARAVEPLPAGKRARCRSHEPGVRAAVRADGTLGHRRGAVQLLGARHRQHGDAGALRRRGNQARMARAVARGRDPLRVLHDRTRRRVFRRDQHPLAHRARRRPLRAERPQVVVLRRRRPALQGLHLHGQDRPERREAPAAVDDRGAARHPRGDDRAHALGLRLRPRPARPRGDLLRKRPGAREEHAARRGPRLRDRAGAPRSRAHPPLHAVDRCGGARPVADVRAGAGARSLRAAAVGDGLDSPGHRTIADRDRPDQAHGAERRAHDGHGREQGGAQGDLDDQGHRPVDGAASHRSRSAGARSDGVSGDTVLAALWAHERTLRLADGPDEVHLEAVARRELQPYTNA